MKNYIWQVLIALDQLANALLLGYADETLSARSYRYDIEGKLHGRVARWCIDAVFYCITLGKDKLHCQRAYYAEVNRRHLPKSYE